MLGTYHHAPRYLAQALAILAAGEHPWAELLGAGDHARGAAGRARGALTAEVRGAALERERRRARVGQQRLPLGVVERLRLVALGLDRAQEAERLVADR